MKLEQRKRIISKHRDSLTRHGYSPNALYWSNRAVQETRFSILASIGIEDTDSLLDVGCGFADFKTWADNIGINLKYTGIDLSPDLIDVAKRLHPDATLIAGDLFEVDFPSSNFNWVVLSGALNENLKDDGAYALKTITRMFQLSNKGVAFNLLDARQIQAHDLQSHQPAQVMNHCYTLTKNCELCDDYLKNDFTIFMRR